MEAFTTKVAGCDVTVLFTGGEYFFSNNFFGLICHAKRNSYSGDKTAFTITVGSENCKGTNFTNDRIVKAAKRIIDREENKYVPKEVEYSIADADLSCCGIEVGLYKF